MRTLRTDSYPYLPALLPDLSVQEALLVSFVRSQTTEGADHVVSVTLTKDVIEQFTGLSRQQQALARTKLRERPFWAEARRRGVGAAVEFTLNVRVLRDTLGGRPDAHE